MHYVGNRNKLHYDARSEKYKKNLFIMCSSMRHLCCLRPHVWRKEQRPCMSKRDRQYTYKLNNEALRLYPYFRGKALSITHLHCVSMALVIQHSNRLYRIILPSMPCPALPYFSTYLINGKIFGIISYWAQKVCFDFLYSFCLKHFSF
jgi:hypothetical protein